MDQNKLALPLFSEVSKKEDLNKKVKTKLIGVICHGRNPPARGYFLEPKFSLDSNVTVEVLRRVLEGIGWETLPPHVFLQLDNTSGSNKNSM